MDGKQASWLAAGGPVRPASLSVGRTPPLSHCPNCGFGLRRFEPQEYGNVRIDGLAEIVFRDRVMALSRSQHDIVEALVRARGRYLTRGVLASRLDREINDSTINKYIERARAAFLAVDPSFDQIECLRGFGAYRWRFRAALQEPRGTPRS